MIARQLGPVIVACVALGCGNKSDADKSGPSGSGSAPAEPARPAPGLETLQVAVAGKPLAMQRAFIKRVSPDQWRIQVGDQVGSCDELLSGITSTKPGATFFVITLARQLRPDGSELVAITDFTAGREPTLSAIGQPAKLAGTSDKGSEAKIELPKIDDMIGKQPLAISGAFTATGCGDQPDTGAGVPKAPHVSAASVVIAGKKLPLKSAILRGSDVVLSTGPKDCSPVTPFAPVVVAHEQGRWELSGTWISPKQTATETMKDVKFVVGATGTSADGPTASLKLSGAGTIGGYAVAFDGVIEAIDCPEQ